MKVGVSITMINTSGKRDEDIYRDELAIADLAEPLGFDSLGAVEHHFTGYAMIPNCTQLLTYMAGRTRRLTLITTVIVLPWHDPVRVAEEIAMLDVLSEGRTIFGFGRGAARTEYDGFRIPMEEARDRFKECCEIVVKGLTQDSFSYRGQFFDIPEIQIRPRPVSNPAERLFAASVSPESGDMMARLGLGVFIIAQKDWDSARDDLLRYEETARSVGLKPRRPIVSTQVSVAESEQEAWDDANQYLAETFRAIDQHYGHTRGALQGVKGYEFHAKMAKTYAKLTSSPEEIQKKALQHYLSLSVVGTPKQCLEKLEYIQQRMGTDHFLFGFSHGGLPLSKAQRSMRLMAEKILPRLKHDPAFAPRPVD
jgi:alkanesulfonate monooxygenase SsuD/methylene tetrahydromethanopterin reductase-like flavin-dependent oxidoreductase (luciferase family)